MGARRLHNYGARVQVILARPAAQLSPAAAHQLDILQRMGVPAAEGGAAEWIAAPALIVDGLIGYSLRGAPRGAAADLIRRANGGQAPILALDVPSGLDTTTGAAYAPTIRAAATLTLALPKVGLLADRAAEWVGELYLADISVPPELYGRPPLSLEVGHLFTGSDILRLR